jgi:alpha-aminoadipic semialdehyde synthase
MLTQAKGNYDHRVFKGATIAKGGKLMEPHDWINRVLYDFSDQKAFKKILLLGSGFVAKPLVDYFMNNTNHVVTIASNEAKEASLISGKRSRAPVLPLNIVNEEALEAAIQSHDIVVSLVPASFHPLVAEKCIKFKKNMVTASYISPKLKDLDQQAKAAGITILNEVGLDPGIDHLTACEVFDNVRKSGGHIKSFVSWCGGLPAPEASNNPLGYKFSWSPKGVLAATQNPALFKKDGQIISINGDKLLEAAQPVSIYNGFAFEGIPNRDSLSYVTQYNLGDLNKIDTMFRGTLRYKGFSKLMGFINKLGYNNNSDQMNVKDETWGGLTKKLLGEFSRNSLSQKLNLSNENEIDSLYQSLHWLGLDDPDLKVYPKSETIQDALSMLLQKKLRYQETERDMVVMHHEFGIEQINGQKQFQTSTLVVYGDPSSYSAMAKTVGIPTAIATELILTNAIKQKGVIAPMTSDIYTPMLKKLKQHGIKFQESVRKTSE